VPGSQGVVDSKFRKNIFITGKVCIMPTTREVGFRSVFREGLTAILARPQFLNFISRFDSGKVYASQTSPLGFLKKVQINSLYFVKNLTLF
jgi:hypothetical protein